MTDQKLYAQDPCQYLDHFRCHFSVLIWRIMTPIFLVIGLSGNTMSLVVFSRKRMRNTTSSVYLRFLAILDSLVLLTALLRELVLFYTYIDVRKLSDFSCRFHIYISSTARLLAIWILCVIALDRLVLIKFPIWAKSKCNKKLSLLTSVILSVAIFTLNSHMIVGFKRSEIKRLSKETNMTILVGYTCSYVTDDFREFFRTTRSIIILVLFSVAPIICLVVSGVIMSREVLSRQQKKQERQANSKDQQEQTVSHSVMKMLIAICVFFVILYVPALVYQLISPYIFNTSLKDDLATKMVFTSILSCLYYSNNSFNFLLYCVSGKLFRKELSDICRETKMAIMKRMNRGVAPTEEEIPGDISITGRPTTSGMAAANRNTKLVTISSIEYEKEAMETFT